MVRAPNCLIPPQSTHSDANPPIVRRFHIDHTYLRPWTNEFSISRFLHGVLYDSSTSRNPLWSGFKLSYRVQVRSRSAPNGILHALPHFATHRRVDHASHTAYGTACPCPSQEWMWLYTVRSTEYLGLIMTQSKSEHGVRSTVRRTKHSATYSVAGAVIISKCLQHYRVDHFLRSTVLRTRTYLMDGWICDKEDVYPQISSIQWAY